MSHLQLSIPVTSPDLRDVLIARLSEEGYDGFEENEGELKAFIKSELYDEDVVREIAGSGSFTVTELPDINWNEEWEKNFQPVVVGTFCGIRASFHQPLTEVQHEIIITPKMSFGTGHHATTYMMVQLLEHVNVQGKTVFDFGTGTGILAILADKLGASEVVAIDNDEWSILNASENLSANKCEHVLLTNSGNIPPGRSFDIIMANINRNVIIANFSPLREQLNEGGVLMVSGLLEADFDHVHPLAVASGLRLQQQLSRSGWIALKYEIV